MSLNGKWFLTPSGSIDVTGSEHVDAAIAVLLLLDRKYAPHTWNGSEIPKAELKTALDRGADPEAVEFLAKGGDARLWVIREFNWIRTAKNVWNMWVFDEDTANIARVAKDYWMAQYSLSEWDMLDITELKDGCRYSISVKKFIEGGSPKTLKKLAMGNVECGIEESPTPVYSTAKFSELERDRLYGRVGANPHKRSR